MSLVLSALLFVMLSRYLKILIGLFVLLLHTCLLFCQTNFKNDKYFVHSYHYGFKEGLTFGPKDMAMDERGHLWLQNYDNLSTYNGFKFTYYYPDENNMYARPRKMTDIIADRSKQIWIAAQEGIYHYSKSKGFIKNTLAFDKKSFDNITTLYANKKNKLWCGNTTGQVILYDPLSKKNLQEKRLPVKSKISSIFEDSLRQIWVTCELGLYVFTVEGKLRVVYDYKNTPNQTYLDDIIISEYKVNEVMINLNNELLYFDISKYSFSKKSTITNKDKTFTIKDYLLIKDNLFIISTNNGIYYYNSKDNIAYSGKEESQSEFGYNEVANKLILTDNGVLFFSTDSGLLKLQYVNEPFKNIALEEEYSSEVLLAKEVGKWADQWLLVTSIGNKYRFKINGRLLNKLHSGIQTKLQGVCLSSDENMLFTMSDGRLYQYAINDTSIGNPMMLLDTKLQNVKKIGIDIKNNIWILSNRDLHCYHVGQKKISRIEIKDDALFDIEIFKNGRICVCGKKLFCTDDDNNFKLISTNNGEFIHDIVAGNFNDVFYTGFSGLYYYSFHTKNMSKYTMKDGMISNDAGNMEMVDSSLWITFASGLQRFDNTSKKFHTFRFESGLKDDNCYDNKLFAIGDKVLMIGGNNYFTYYQKSKRTPLKTVALNIEAIYFDDELVSDVMYNNYDITVPTHIKQINVLFDFPLFLHPSYYNMEYRLLEGKDSSWHVMPSNMSLQFYELKPNYYRLEVRAQDANIREFSKSISLNLNVLAPFYKKAVFQVMVFFILSGLVSLLFYGLYRYKLKQIKKLNDLRLSISRDLHDEMGSELSAIKLLSELEVMKARSNESSSFKKIAEKSSLVMESMSDIVWSINPANDEMGKIIEKIQNQAYDVLETKGINVLVDVDENVKKYFINMEKRRHFYLIFKESIHNIAKYAKATEVKINISINSNLLESTISDNGVGFYTLGKTQGNGLRNMKERAALLGGKIEIESNNNNGTSIHFSFPV